MMSVWIIRVMMALVFIAAGITHFVRRDIFIAIVPPFLHNPALLVELSGIAEILGGIGLLLPGTRKVASIGLFALLIAVWPANWYMAIQAGKFAQLAPAWVLWLRLPLQLVFMGIILRVGR